jgi:predicted kinase
MSAIADAVSSLEVARATWRQAASHAGADLRVIEVTCSDEELHRSRLAARVRSIDGFAEPTWGRRRAQAR